MLIERASVTLLRHHPEIASGALDLMLLAHPTLTDLSGG